MILDRTAPNRKPAFGSAQVNWAHPLANGLKVLFLLDQLAGSSVFSMGRQGGLSGSRLVTNSGWSQTGRGAGLLFSASNDDIQLESINDAAYATPSPFSIEVIMFMPTTVVGFGGACSFVKSGQTGSHFSDGGGSASAFRPNLVLVSSGGSETANWRSPTALTTPLLKHFLATYDGTTGKIYVDGVDQVATSDSPLGYGTATNIRLGRNVFQRQNLTALKVSLYARVLTAAEASWLAAEPYTFLTPKAPRLWMLGAPSATAAAAQIPYVPVDPLFATWQPDPSLRYQPLPRELLTPSDTPPQPFRIPWLLGVVRAWQSEAPLWSVYDESGYRKLLTPSDTAGPMPLVPRDQVRRSWELEPPAWAVYQRSVPVPTSGAAPALQQPPGTIGVPYLRIHPIVIA